MEQFESYLLPSMYQRDANYAAASTLIQPSQPTMITIPLQGTTVHPPHHVEYEHSLSAYVNRPVEPINSDISPVVQEFKAHRSDWKDFEPGKQACVKLSRLNPEDVVSLGLETFKQIKHAPTPRSVAALFLLAFNLRNEHNNLVFSDIPDELTPIQGGAHLSKFSDIPFKRIPNQLDMVLKRTTDDDDLYATHLATGFSYIACSYLRLYIKPADKYFLAYKGIREKFKKIYGFNFPFSKLRLDIEAIESIKRLFELYPMFKHTFYQLLYAGEDCRRGRRIKEFLYRRHVELPGIHSFRLFEECMQALDVSNTCLMRAMRNEKFMGSLTELANVFDNLVVRSLDHRLGMWRFARIFDNTFLYNLQTRRCKQFTLSLAYVLQLLRTERSKKVMKIVEFDDIGDTQREEAMAYANEIVHKVFNNMDNKEQ